MSKTLTLAWFVPTLVMIVAICAGSGCKDRKKDPGLTGAIIGYHHTGTHRLSLDTLKMQRLVTDYYRADAVFDPEIQCLYYYNRKQQSVYRSKGLGTETPELLVAIDGMSKGEVDQLALSPHGRRLLALCHNSSTGGFAVVIDIGTQSISDRFRLRSYAGAQPAWIDDTQVLIPTNCVDPARPKIGSLHVWDLTTKTSREVAFPQHVVAVSSSGRFVATCDDGGYYVYTYPDLSLVNTLPDTEFPGEYTTSNVCFVGDTHLAMPRASGPLSSTGVILVEVASGKSQLVCKKCLCWLQYYPKWHE